MLVAAGFVLAACGSSPPLGAGGTSTSSSGGHGGGGAGGAVPALHLIDVSNPMDLTPDGRLALLQDFESMKGDVYIFDAQSETLTKRGDAANPDPAQGDATKGTPLPPQGAAGISADGSRIVGTHGMPLQPALLEAGGWKDLGVVPGTSACAGDPTNLDDGGSAGSGWDLTPDGHDLVGMAWDGCGKGRAVRWSDAGGVGAFTMLDFGGVGFDRATKIADDGSLVGGFVGGAAVDRSPAVWDVAGKLTRLDPAGAVVGEVLAIAADGVVAGIWNDVEGNAGFRWSASTGVQKLPALADALPSDQVFPNAVAAGGALIFGGAGDFNGLGNPMRAFVWSRKDDTARLLQPIVEGAGFTLPANVTLASVLAASSDGTVLLGTTLEADPDFPTPKQRVFLVRLPVSAYGL